MNMKDHILAALQEQLESWEELLAKLTEEEITSPRFDLNWSIKDVTAHLWAWQQISIARMEGGLYDKEPSFPAWIVESVENWDENSDQVNALTFEIQHKKPWPEIYQNWKIGFLHFIQVGSAISERDLLDGDKYPWLKGYSLAFILIASYDHHQEHLEKLLAWQQKRGTC
jgi:hypothetical protein